MLQHMVQITPPITPTYNLDTKCDFYDKVERSGCPPAFLCNSNDIHCRFCDGYLNDKIG